MKGIILAGGFGTRLKPMTNVTNKHLLPVYDKPMIYYPIDTLVSAGIKDILIVTGSEHAGDFLNLLGDGSEFGCNFTYRVQTGAGGIAAALALGEDFAGNEPIVVILGDNIFDFNFKNAVENFDESGAEVFLKEVNDPERFGVATINNDSVIKITEKPSNPETNLAVTGIYFYNYLVWQVIKKLVPSERGEKEITDVNNWYVEHGLMKHRIIDNFWSDAGMPESLFKSSEHIRNKR